MPETPAAPADATSHATALRPGHPSPAVDAFPHFPRTPAATRVMRAPGAAVPPARLRPAAHVTPSGA